MPARLIRHPRFDLGLALTFAALTVVQVLVWPIADRPLGVLVALVSTLPLAWRRTHPALATFVGITWWAIPLDRYPLLGFAAAYVLFYSLGAYEPRTWPVVVLPALGFALSLGVGLATHAGLGELLSALAVPVAPVLVGRFVRFQRAQSARLAELAHHLDRERERSARAAVGEERERIARELHDIVAHAISVIGVQADAAEAALDQDPARARAPLAAIRTSAAGALGEMRRLLGALRTEEDAGRAPTPGLDGLDALLDGARAAGVAVTLREEGERPDLPASVDLSAYRIVQEGLTNVRKHAGGAPAEVLLTWRAHEGEIEVRDHGPGVVNGALSGGAGHGLVGMRERTRLHGGELDAGPAPGGGFRVRATLRLDAPA